MTKPPIHLFAAAMFALASSCSGCFGCTPPGIGDGGTLPSSCVVNALVPEPQKLDVLFVIDNSSSMKEEQEGVARELTAFIDELKKGGGVTTDFNIGVITSGVYQHTFSGGIDFNKEYPSESGRLQPVPDADPDGGVLIGTGTERVLNGADPMLVSKFARLVQQGTNGSGQETPFEALRLAVTDLDKIALANGGNGGFLRDGARLLIVILTDEDDCSEIGKAGTDGRRLPSVVTVGENPLVDYCGDKATSLATVSDYHQIFSQLKDTDGNPREVIWTAIAPVARTNKAAMSVVEGGQVRNIDCPTSNEPGHRHRKMAEMFNPTLVNLDSICRDSYRETLLLIAGLANVTQTLEVNNVPDVRMMQIRLTRRDSTVQLCTKANGGVEKYEGGKVYFSPTCLRRADDRFIDIKMLCVN